MITDFVKYYPAEQRNDTTACTCPQAILEVASRDILPSWGSSPCVSGYCTVSDGHRGREVCWVGTTWSYIPHKWLVMNYRALESICSCNVMMYIIIYLHPNILGKAGR